jgi:predicted transcriptional regulator/DNA-binding XRE family transcriptional regulator
MTKLTGKIVKAVRVGDDDAGRVVGKSLKALRELAGLTQTQMARRLKIGQAAISKIEYRGDVQILSLQKYVEALGAQLRIDATFPDDAVVASKLKDVFDTEIADENQLVFPIFGDDLFRSQRDVVLSIRPQHSDKIFQGKKTVELRRRFPVSAPRGTIAYIYCTSPVRAMIGRAEITDIIKLPIADIWRKYGNSASIDKTEFDSYFDGLDEGFALKFANAQHLPRQLDLSELRERFGFEPPQSFLYATPVLRRALRDEYSGVSH